MRKRRPYEHIAVKLEAVLEVGIEVVELQLENSRKRVWGASRLLEETNM